MATAVALATYAKDAVVSWQRPHVTEAGGREPAMRLRDLLRLREGRSHFMAKTTCDGSGREGASDPVKRPPAHRCRDVALFLDHGEGERKGGRRGMLAQWRREDKREASATEEGGEGGECGGGREVTGERGERGGGAGEGGSSTEVEEAGREHGGPATPGCAIT